MIPPRLQAGLNVAGSAIADVWSIAAVARMPPANEITVVNIDKRLWGGIRG